MFINITFHLSLTQIWSANVCIINTCLLSFFRMKYKNRLSLSHSPGATSRHCKWVLFRLLTQPIRFDWFKLFRNSFFIFFFNLTRVALLMTTSWWWRKTYIHTLSHWTGLNWIQSHRHVIQGKDRILFQFIGCYHFQQNRKHRVNEIIRKTSKCSVIRDHFLFFRTTKFCFLLSTSTVNFATSKNTCFGTWSVQSQTQDDIDDDQWVTWCSWSLKRDQRQRSEFEREKKIETQFVADTL